MIAGHARELVTSQTYSMENGDGEEARQVNNFGSQCTFGVTRYIQRYYILQYIQGYRVLHI